MTGHIRVYFPSVVYNPRQTIGIDGDSHRAADGGFPRMAAPPVNPEATCYGVGPGNPNSTVCPNPDILRHPWQLVPIGTIPPRNFACIVYDPRLTQLIHCDPHRTASSRFPRAAVPVVYPISTSY